MVIVMGNEQDKKMYSLCVEVSKKSKCLSRKIGAVITKDDIVISTGYNGPPKGVVHCDDKEYRKFLVNKMIEDDSPAMITYPDKPKKCPRRHNGFISGEGLEYCKSVHAEVNAILFAINKGVSVEGGTLYLNWITPCIECSKIIINAGIKEIVVTKNSEYEPVGLTGKYLLGQSNIKIRTYQK